jgi:GPH family glycoside/pentoside/hexuronide:cation symporter
MMLFFLVGEGDLVLMACVLAWSGCAFSAGNFLGPSMQADVIDYDELYTGKRREAQYNGLWSIMTKFTVIPSMSIPLAVLAAYGYQPNVAQSDTVVFVIRAIFALAPASTSVIAFMIATRYPITKAAHEKIWEGIEAHKRGEPAIDPLTDKLLPPPTDRGVDEDTGWFLDHFSSGELRRYLATGAQTVIVSSLSWVILFATISTAGIWNTVRVVSDLTSEPGIGAVFSVVIAGVSFAAFCFGVMRVRAAFRLRAAPIEPAQVEGHLAFTEFVTNGKTRIEPALAREY